MKDNPKSLVGTIPEIEKSLLDNSYHVYYGSDFNTGILFESVPCKVVATSSELAKVTINFFFSFIILFAQF